MNINFWVVWWQNKRELNKNYSLHKREFPNQSKLKLCVTWKSFVPKQSLEFGQGVKWCDSWCDSQRLLHVAIIYRSSRTEDTPSLGVVALCKYTVLPTAKLFMLYCIKLKLPNRCMIDRTVRGNRRSIGAIWAQVVTTNAINCKKDEAVGTTTILQRLVKPRIPSALCTSSVSIIMLS